MTQFDSKRARFHKTTIYFVDPSYINCIDNKLNKEDLFDFVPSTLHELPFGSKKHPLASLDKQHIERYVGSNHFISYTDQFDIQSHPISITGTGVRLG